MTDHFYGVDIGGTMPIDVVEGPGTLYKHIELRVIFDAVGMSRTKVLEFLSAVEKYVAQDTWPPTDPAPSTNQRQFEVKAGTSSFNIGVHPTGFPPRFVEGDELSGSVQLAYRPGNSGAWQLMRTYTKRTIDQVTFPQAGQALVVYSLPPDVLETVLPPY